MQRQRKTERPKKSSHDSIISLLREMGKTFQDRLEKNSGKKDHAPTRKGDKPTGTRNERKDDPKDVPPPVIYGEEIEGAVKARLRAVSWLWNTTIPSHLNPFGTDGDKSVPNTWPGDKLRQCRQWHGIDLGYDLQGSVPVNISYKTPHYVGTSTFCGVTGRAFTTDRWVREPVVLMDARGPYVEVKSLLGSRVGIYIPDIDVGHDYTGWHNIVGIIGSQILEEITEQLAEEGYTGSDDDVPKIYDFVRLKLYTDGHAEGEYVSQTAGNGFVETAEIIETPIGYSLVPEHHLYLNDRLVKSVTPQSSDGYDEWVQWIDTNLPYEVTAHAVLAESLAYWCRNASAEEKNAYMTEFRSKFPDYFVQP